MSWVPWKGCKKFIQMGEMTYFYCEKIGNRADVQGFDRISQHCFKERAAAVYTCGKVIAAWVPYCVDCGEHLVW